MIVLCCCVSVPAHRTSEQQWLHPPDSEQREEEGHLRHQDQEEQGQTRQAGQDHTAGGADRGHPTAVFLQGALLGHHECHHRRVRLQRGQVLPGHHPVAHTSQDLSRPHPRSPALSHLVTPDPATPQNQVHWPNRWPKWIRCYQKTRSSHRLLRLWLER